MAANNVLDNLSEDPENLDSRIFDLVVGRILKKVYLDLDERGREEVGRIFISGDDAGKEGFIKKYIPNFKNLFKEEAKKIGEEVEVEIEKII